MKVLTWIKSNSDTVWKVWFSVLLVWLILTIKDVANSMPETPRDVTVTTSKYGYLDVKVSQ